MVLGPSSGFGVGSAAITPPYTANGRKQRPILTARRPRVEPGLPPAGRPQKRLRPLDRAVTDSLNCTTIASTVGEVMAPFRFSITTGSGTPIYRQLVDQVRLAVATEALSPGDRMPSVRDLAEELVINFNTVAKAY